MDTEPADEAHAPRFGGYKNARRLLIGGMVVGFALPVVFSLQSSTPSQVLSTLTVGLAVVVASLAIGGLIGFVFGIPRLLQAESTPPGPAAPGEPERPGRRAPYAGNTSLEQISDWLTKIIVGVGLTQLANVPAALASLGQTLAGGLGNLPGAAVFGAGLVVYAVLDGFFLSYFWTRLYLPSLFVESDLSALLTNAKERGIKQGELQALRTTTPAPEPGAALQPRGAEEGRPQALWVDDHPENNEGEADLIEQRYGVRIRNVTSTDEALKVLQSDPGTYTFVITDMGRGTDRHAAYTLIRKMRLQGSDQPVIVYAASASPQEDLEARRRGAVAMTNSPSRLIELVGDVVRTASATQKRTGQPKPQ
jgi:CheY-like chemotaxis protein